MDYDSGWKPVVHFTGPVEYYSSVSSNDGTVFKYARVQGLDHPELGDALIRTSQIIEIVDANNEFHTINSIYRRADK